MIGEAKQAVGALVFALALLHTFGVKWFERLARRHLRHGGLFRLLSEVEVVCGLWAAVQISILALAKSGKDAIAYLESRDYTELLFVFVVIVVAASRPVLDAVRRALSTLAKWMPLRQPTALGVLFVNVSIGGTLTAYAAPPVLMVADTWNWDTIFMATRFGWRAGLAVLVNSAVVTFLLRNHMRDTAANESAIDQPVPTTVSAIHLGFLAAEVVFSHHPAVFFGIFLIFLGYAQAYERYQSPLILKEGLLVGFFLAGLVVLGGVQQWWPQPIVSRLEPRALFFGALGLTAITDNAALIY